jgi:hypothetical protein
MRRVVAVGSFMRAGPSLTGEKPTLRGKGLLGYSYRKASVSFARRGPLFVKGFAYRAFPG